MAGVVPFVIDPFRDLGGGDTQQGLVSRATVRQPRLRAGERGS
jgi:hypothetical protein